KCKTLTTWTGLYLKIKLGYNIGTIRTIAGRIIYGNEKTNPTLPEHSRETEAAMFGAYKIIFEGGKPTFGVLIDELIGAKLSQEDFAKAAGKDEDATIKAIEDGFYSFPEKYAFMQHSFAKNSSKKHFTFQNGTNVSVYSFQPRAEDGVLMEKLDILPFTKFRTLHENPKESFELSLKHSLKYMNLEKKNYTKSGLGIVKGKEISILNQEQFSKKAKLLYKEDGKKQWSKLKKSSHTFNNKITNMIVLPSDYKGYYSLHSGSGTVIAHGLSGAGSGVEETQQTFSELNNAITVFSIIAGRLGVVGPAFVMWAALEKAKMKWLEKATIAIITMEGMSSDEFNQTMMETLCNTATDIVGSFGGDVAGRLGEINDIFGMLNLPSFSDCGLQNTGG
ncbi:MAG: hypothetical protein ACPG5P_05295, partial [Saprospiraceae bacterium]